MPKRKKIKTCPMCGGRAKVIQFFDGKWKVYCRECYVGTPILWKKDEVINVWNRRADT